MPESKTQNDFNQRLLEFLTQSPTPFHAVDSIKRRLESVGFESLLESDEWNLQPGGSYYVCRNDSSIIAFVYGRQSLQHSGIRMVGAHTDSPCLKVKPQPELKTKGYFQLGVETYGGVLLNPWFDRDLSLAGRVTYRTDQGQVKSELINFERAIATIPSLAIHLDREANKNRSINAQTDIAPILMQVDTDDATDFRALLAAHLAENGVSGIDKVLDYELSFYDTQAPAITGWKNEFIASARLDNLLSCFIGLEAMLQADGEQSVLLMCNDHEEVGSRSSCGAQGPMLADFLNRLLPDAQDRLRTISQSLMVSADNAHGIHPNFAAKHDANHGPLLNRGPVIKVNANQSYATNSESSALFRHWAELSDVAIQAFVTRTDLGCGSTIGPITAAEVGVRTLDVGVPTFAMHSIRELAGVSDAHNLLRILCEYFQHSSSLADVSR